MRVAIVRTDIQKIYLSDIENSSQRDFSSEPKGQSRYFVHPTDAQLTAVLAAAGPVTKVGSNTGPFDTTGGNNTKLNVRTSATGAYVQVAVRSGGAVTADQVASDLNLAFKNAGVQVAARVASNAIVLDTLAGGPNAYLEISASSPSAGTLQTVLGLVITGVTGVSLSTLKAAIYPTATTANVASATILALGTYSNLTTAAKAALVAAIQDLVAPRLVETSLVLRSFSYGVIAGLRNPNFQPGGARAGLKALQAAYVLADDGSTPFVL